MFLRTAVYAKNVPFAERVLRVVLGIGLIAGAVYLLLKPSPSLLFAAVLVFSALFVMITGFVGWCPACALVGRKLKTK